MTQTGSPLPKILIVEDEAIIREILAEFLRLDGFEVMEADGGNPALEILKTESFELILTDWMMDDGSGENLVRSIRAINQVVPIVVLSANTELTAESLKDYRIDQLIAKPFDPDGLVATVKQLVMSNRNQA
ncbi:MAG: response regulator [Proteobacteria bacterium]|nr:MAG: response regulator [Pseudomonadota bacterium]